MNESLLAYPFLEKKKRKGLFRIKNVYLKQQYAFFFLQAIILQTIFAHIYRDLAWLLCRSP